MKEIQGKLLGDAEARSELITAFKKLCGSVAKTHMQEGCVQNSC